MKNLKILTIYYKKTKKEFRQLITNLFNTKNIIYLFELKNIFFIIFLIIVILNCI